MTVVAARQEEAREVLDAEECVAWTEYLETTHGQSSVRYEEVEPWAWGRLQMRLKAIATRRSKLKA